MGNVVVDETTNDVTVAAGGPYTVETNTPGSSTFVSNPTSAVTIAPSISGSVQVNISSPGLQINETPATSVEIGLGIPGPLDAETRFALAMDPDTLISGAITRSATEAVTSAPVTWPDGTVGVFTGVESTIFPGAIDSYTITYRTTTYTQHAVTRDGTGAVTNRPAIIVS